MLGWEQAFWTVFLWGIATVYHAFVASQFHVHPLIFTCMTFLSAAFVLTLFGGKGFLVKETLKSPATWMYGLVTIVTYTVCIYLFQLVTATEGALLRRISVVIALLIGVFFLKRDVRKNAFFGAASIVFGVLLVGYGLPSDISLKVAFLLCIAAFFHTTQLIVAEKHPQTNRARSVREECRVVGLVMFILATVLLLISVLLILLFPDSKTQTLIPRAIDFAHMPTLVSGFIFGVFLIGPIKFLEFTSVRKIKTENFLALAAFTPIVTFLCEALISRIPISGMTIQPISFLDIVAGLFITFGSFYIAWQQMRQDYLLYQDRKDKEEFSFKAFMKYTEKNEELMAADLTTVREKDDKALKEEMEMKRIDMDMISLKRMRASVLSEEEKDVLKEQERIDASIEKNKND